MSVRDAVKGHFTERLAPNFALPYIRLARLERPIGWWLLLLPCWWSVLLVDSAVLRQPPSLLLCLLFMIGAIAMRGAGCTWNDIVDADIDAKVARTALRPIPSKQVTLPQARLFGVFLALIGAAVLLALNPFAIAVGLASLLVVLIYPFMKRITFWPQLTLGLAFSWGSLMGFAVLGRLPPAAFLLYAGSICWVIGYDTIYAHQDREDDAFLNIGSTARLFGHNTKPWLIGFYSAAVVFIALSFYAAGAGAIAYLSLVAFACHLHWQVNKLNVNDAENCLMLFRSNKHCGLIISFGLLLESLRFYF
jgi:4-hydroxybenzoate polyprenyltransferase